MCHAREISVFDFWIRSAPERVLLEVRPHPRTTFHGKSGLKFLSNPANREAGRKKNWHSNHNLVKKHEATPSCAACVCVCSTSVPPFHHTWPPQGLSLSLLIAKLPPSPNTPFTLDSPGPSLTVFPWSLKLCKPPHSTLHTHTHSLSHSLTLSQLSTALCSTICWALSQLLPTLSLLGKITALQASDTHTRQKLHSTACSN